MFALKLLLWILVGFRSVATASSIQHYAALGDSYAAGDGAGSPRLFPHLDFGCGRFDGAYPVRVANDSKLNVEDSDFLYLACGGASTGSVSKTQIPRIKDADAVTVTVGGNEVDFFAVLNACVYEWLPPITSCEDEIIRAKKLAQSDAFLKSFTSMIASAMNHRKVGAQVLVTGYARFFNDTTNQCNHVSFNRRHPDKFLTTELRQGFNQMVDAINLVIQSATEVHGATYVDIDAAFDGHRFCEANVTEPSDREETWFFNLEYPDDNLILPSVDKFQVLFPNPIKDFFDLTKTFHPTSLGHKAIAELIVTLLTD